MKKALTFLVAAVLFLGMLPVTATAARGVKVVETMTAVFSLTKDDYCYWEPYSDASKGNRYSTGHQTSIVARVENDLKETWYKTAGDKYFFGGSVTEEWREVKSIKTTYALKAADYSHEQPFEASKKVKSYSKGTRVTMVAEVKNKYGNTWYKTEDGTYIYSDDLVFESKWKTVETMTAVFAFNYADKSHKQPYEASAAVKSYGKDAEVDVVAAVRNDYNNLWYQLKDGSFVYKDDITEQWRVTDTFNYYYKFNKNDESRKKPFESSTLVKSYSKGAVVRAVAAVKNKYGNTWYKLSDGSYIYSGDVDGYYRVIQSLDQYFWVTSLTAASHKYPDDSSDKVKTYVKGEYMHIVEEVKNNRGVSGGNTWYKTDKGTFLYSGDIEYRYHYIDCKTGVYEAVKTGELCSTPFTENNQTPVPTGTLVTVTAAVKNKHGNTWYEIKEASGTKKWVWADCFKYVGNTSGKITALDFDAGALAMIALGGYTYTGKAVEPGVVVRAGSATLRKGTDYTVSYKNNVNAGTATVTVTGKGAYTGTLSKTFKINPRKITELNFDTSAVAIIGLGGFTYTGKAVKPGVVVKCDGTTLKKGTDYTVAYKNNVEVGTATVTATGKGNYTGTLSRTFKIIPDPYRITSLDFNAAAMSVIALGGYTYTGKAVKPGVVVKADKTKLTKDKDYTVTYKNNVNAGTATVTVKGKGSYHGTLSKTFKILPVKLKSVTVNNASVPYKGKAIEAPLKVKADVNGKTKTFTTAKDKGKVFTVTYKNNVNVGTATVTVKGIGNYTGTLTATFKIKPVKLTSVKVKNASLPYTGRLHTPILIVKAKVDGKTVTVSQSKYCTVTYKNNLEPGTANVTVKGKGNFTGTVTTTFKINKLKLNDKTATVELSKTEMKYTGKALKPKVTVTSKLDGAKYTLVKGTDYTVTYTNNIKRGTATVTIKGIGHFTGTVTVHFTIK